MPLKDVSTNERDTVVVVGAGIVGVCTAWHLLRRGADVTLIDREMPLAAVLVPAGFPSPAAEKPLTEPTSSFFQRVTAFFGFTRSISSSMSDARLS